MQKKKKSSGLFSGPKGSPGWVTTHPLITLKPKCVKRAFVPTHPMLFSERGGGAWVQLFPILGQNADLPGALAGPRCAWVPPPPGR